MSLVMWPKIPSISRIQVWWWQQFLISHHCREKGVSVQSCAYLCCFGFELFFFLSNLAQGQMLVAADRGFWVYIVQEMLEAEAEKYQIFLYEQHRNTRIGQKWINCCVFTLKHCTHRILKCTKKTPPACVISAFWGSKGMAHQEQLLLAFSVSGGLLLEWKWKCCNFPN